MSHIERAASELKEVLSDYSEDFLEDFFNVLDPLVIKEVVGGNSLYSDNLLSLCEEIYQSFSPKAKENINAVFNLRRLIQSRRVDRKGKLRYPRDPISPARYLGCRPSSADLQATDPFIWEWPAALQPNTDVKEVGSRVGSPPETHDGKSGGIQKENQEDQNSDHNFSPEMLPLSTPSAIEVGSQPMLKRKVRASSCSEEGEEEQHFRCLHNGCKKMFQRFENTETSCKYHPGTTTYTRTLTTSSNWSPMYAFHIVNTSEEILRWTCCQKPALVAFCTEGRHREKARPFLRKTTVIESEFKSEEVLRRRVLGDGVASPCSAACAKKSLRESFVGDTTEDTRMGTPTLWEKEENIGLKI
ncbi:hypothetical protein GQ43DRAFT_495862 [Delitschia confertaspora ATCC 74209]|uniref:C2H2-type domain-containing protein n=1 Tax=Delitschia confertaspora ATCC 74209 TaxID=1513339 RepID=A0A9P4MLR9_9PLEO|nr:hypothetical protein GQ43DRAFT_495862 [Delitschia confertaspora ATCC 74209]